VADLKEASTLYVSSWLKRYVWRLPVEVPYVPKRRRLWYVAYALMSGFYSYSVLYLVAGFVGNVFKNFSAEWSFVPEWLTAVLIFRSRIRTLVNFMKFVYLDKRDRVRAWFTPRRSIAVVAVALIVLFLPLWRQTVTGKFLLEPASRSIVRATSPGIITAVYSTEGAKVTAGTPLMALRNVELQSKLALTRANYEVASTRVSSAVLHFGNVGALQHQRDVLKAQNAGLTAQVAHLDVASPQNGTVITPSLGDQLGVYATAGAELAEIADLSEMRARIYISEYEMSRFHLGSEARIEVDGALRKWNATALGISTVSSEINPALADRAQYKGLNPPLFYVVDLRIANGDGRLKPGMSGLARLYGSRESIAGHLWRAVADFFGRKVW
jgi:putative peptide zinc metalloprotease protein